VATHFSRLLRHAWVTVGLFLFPGHHTAKSKQPTDKNHETRYHTEDINNNNMAFRRLLR